MFAKKISSISKFGLLLVVLVLLSLFLTGCVDVERIFTAGCVDMDVAMKIEGSNDSGYTLFTITTDSEESFEVLKDSFLDDSEDDEEEQDQVEISIDEEESTYSMIIRDELTEGGYQIETRDSRVVYTLEDIVLDLGGIIAEEKIDGIIASCDGYYFSFRVDLPNEVKKAWWIDSENKKIEEVAVDHINDRSFSFTIPMDTVVSQTKTKEWADRSGVMIQTEI